MKFEVRRGGEDSAAPKDLAFEVGVNKTEQDELFLNVKFENPYLVSTGEKKDMLVAEVVDSDFFSRTSDAESVKEGT